MFQTIRWLVIFWSYWPYRMLCQVIWGLRKPVSRWGGGDGRARREEERQDQNQSDEKAQTVNCKKSGAAQTVIWAAPGVY